MQKSCLFLICFFILIISSDKAFSVDKISKKLKLKENYSHLLRFDEKIIRYRAANKDFDVEILPDIFNNRHEMIIKPLKRTKTNILVWTQTKIYSFDIESRQGKDSGIFFNFNKTNQNLSKEILSVLNKQELDLPPDLSGKKIFENFEIDLPPTPE